MKDTQWQNILNNLPIIENNLFYDFKEIKVIKEGIDLDN